MTAVEKIPDFITRLNTVDELKNVMENAKSAGREDVYWAAFERLCAIQGDRHNSELEKDFYRMLAAYEELLSQKNNRNQPAIRTRQKLKRHGIKKCLEDWALAKTETQGFKLLVEKGKAHLTAEAIVLKHNDMFSNEIVLAAKTRLEAHGVKL
jgi:hypothetical protein